MLSFWCHAMEDGGCSMPVWLPAPCAARSTCLDLLCISVLASTLACSAGLLEGTPSMCAGVRNALGPGCLSLRMLNSLHGGADQMQPSRPLEAVRRASLKWLSCKISKGGSDSMSNGWKQSACKPCIAVVRGECLPENRSMKSL